MSRPPPRANTKPLHTALRSNAAARSAPSAVLHQRRGRRLRMVRGGGGEHDHVHVGGVNPARVQCRAGAPRARSEAASFRRTRRREPMPVLLSIQSGVDPGRRGDLCVVHPAGRQVRAPAEGRHGRDRPADHTGVRGQRGHRATSGAGPSAVVGDRVVGAEQVSGRQLPGRSFVGQVGRPGPGCRGAHRPRHRPGRQRAAAPAERRGGHWRFGHRHTPFPNRGQPYRSAWSSSSGSSPTTAGCPTSRSIGRSLW